MRLEGEQALLRIHLSNLVKWRQGPLYEAIVEKARREHLAGATVLTGIAGYFGEGPLLGGGASGLRQERPVVVEIVDGAEVLDRFLDRVLPMVEGKPVIVTLERARVAPHRSPEGRT